MVYVKYNGNRKFYYWFLLPFILIDMLLFGGDLEIVKVKKEVTNGKENTPKRPQV